MMRGETDATQVPEQISKTRGREPGAVFGAGTSHLGDHHIGAATSEGEDQRRCQHLAQHIADEAAVREQAVDVGAESAAFGAITGTSGFRQRCRDTDGDQNGQHGDDVKDCAPAKSGLQQAAGQWAQHLRDHQHRDHQADHRADALVAVQIANDGAAHHHAGSATERLQEACCDQLRQGLGETAGDTGHDHQPEADQQHRPASKSVRKRSHDDLRARQPDHEQRHRHLRDRNIATEGGCEQRQRRNQHIERDRRDTSHRDQQQ
jgi:hypothetical protein